MKTSKINDFGAKIGGARKDMYQAAKESAELFMSASSIEALTTCDSFSKLVRLPNLESITAAGAISAEDASYDFEGGTIEVSAEDERIRIIFDERPERPMIENLKKNGFHWSPSNGAWQRQTTSNAKWAVKQLFKIDVK